jgi:hypothetical protein
MYGDLVKMEKLFNLLYRQTKHSSVLILIILTEELFFSNFVTVLNDNHQSITKNHEKLF